MCRVVSWLLVVSMSMCVIIQRTKWWCIIQDECVVQGGCVSVTRTFSLSLYVLANCGVMYFHTEICMTMVISDTTCFHYIHDCLHLLLTLLVHVFVHSPTHHQESTTTHRHTSIWHFFEGCLLVNLDHLKSKNGMWTTIVTSSTAKHSELASISCYLFNHLPLQLSSMLTLKLILWNNFDFHFRNGEPKES